MSVSKPLAGLGTCDWIGAMVTPYLGLCRGSSFLGVFWMGNGTGMGLVAAAAADVVAAAAVAFAAAVVVAAAAAAMLGVGIGVGTGKVMGFTASFWFGMGLVRDCRCCSADC